MVLVSFVNPRIPPDLPDSLFWVVKCNDHGDNIVVNQSLDQKVFFIIDPIQIVESAVIDVLDLFLWIPYSCPRNTNNRKTEVPYYNKHPREGTKGLHTHLILFCIIIGEWLNENECTLNELIPFFILFPKSCRWKYFVAKIFCCTSSWPELVAFIHMIIIHPNCFSSTLTLHHHLINRHCKLRPFTKTLKHLVKIINKKCYFSIPPRIKG